MGRLMVLGAGVYQVPLIQKVLDLGHEALVVSPLGSYPGIALATLHLDLDTTDIKSVLEAARVHNIDGVLTSGSDVCLPAMGAVVEELGLKGPGRRSARLSSDKIEMKKALTRGNVPVASFVVVSTEEEALEALGELGLPAILKPVDSSGSRGVTRIDAPEEVSRAWSEAVQVTRGEEFLVERFLQGEEFGAQALVRGDEVVLVSLHNDTMILDPRPVPVGHSLPHRLPEALAQKAHAVCVAAIQALGLRDCAVNLDLMLCGEEVFVLEAGARAGGTCLPENVSLWEGIDFYGALVALALGDALPERGLRRRPNASLLIVSKRSGRVRQVGAEDALLNHPGVVEFCLDVGPGDQVHAFDAGNKRIGHIIVEGVSVEEAEALASSLLKNHFVLELD